MPWELVRAGHTANTEKQPFISISCHRIAFGALFSRSVELSAAHRVSVFVDEETRRVGFEFHTDQRPDSLALVQENRTKSKRHTGLFCSSRSLVTRYDWVMAVTKLAPRERRFQPRKESGKWVVELCPAFEMRKARESRSIPSGAVGVYRYKREDGEVVYIGRGDVRKRLASPDREDWDFDLVEYSVVPNPDDQVRWETFWLERFRAEKGHLPFYNKVAGRTSEDE